MRLCPLTAEKKPWLRREFSVSREARVAIREVTLKGDTGSVSAIGILQ